MFPFYLSALIVDMALGAVLLCVPLFAIKRFDVSPLFLGYIGTLGALFYSSFVIVFGRLCDRLNRKVILFLGCILFSVTYTIMPHLKHQAWILVVYPFGSVAMAMFWPSIQSWIALGKDERRLLGDIGKFNISWSMGLMLGPLIGGFLFQINDHAPFIFASSLIILAIILLSKQPLVLEKKKPEGETITISGEQTNINRPASQKLLYVAWVANLASWFTIGMIRNQFPKLGVFLGISPVLIGTLIFAMGFSQTGMFFLLIRSRRWQFKTISIIPLQALASLGLLMIFLNRLTSVLFLGFIFLGLCSGMTYFSSIFYSLYGHQDKGRKSGLHEGFLGAGILFGPLLGGLAAQEFGLRAPYLVAFILIWAAIAVEIAIIRGLWGKTPKNYIRAL